MNTHTNVTLNSQFILVLRDYLSTLPFNQVQGFISEIDRSVSVSVSMATSQKKPETPVAPDGTPNKKK